MYIVPFFPSLAIGMMAANLVAWRLRSARATFEKEAKGMKGASFKESMKHLATASLLLLIVTTPVSAMGTLNYFYLTSDGIHANALFSIKERHYGWGDVQEIRIRCLAERNNLHLNYILVMKDGARVDLLEEPRLKFVEVYDQIKPLVEAQNGITFRREIRDADIYELRRRYSAENAGRILQILRDEP
jgi:hypothetical protein